MAMPAMDLVVEGGTVVHETGQFVGSVGIRDGKIAALRSSLTSARLSGRRTLDARGKLVLPGVIDAHVHMELEAGRARTADDFASGSVAGAFGGVTTMIDFATQARGESLLDAVKRRRALAEGRSAIDFGLHCAVTDWNARTRGEMKSVVKYGVPSFKLFMAYEDKGWMADDGFLFECLEEAGRLGALVGVHAENPRLIAAFTRRALASGKRGAALHAASRPNVTESEAIARAAYLASVCMAKLYIFHLSTLEGCKLVEEWNRKGYPVFAETCPQYLVLDESALGKTDGHLLASCPPLRKKADRAYLWEALERKAVDVIATDHCSFTRAAKNTWRGDFRRIPYGLPGIETALPLLVTRGLDKEISLRTLVDVLATNPAKIFGLYPRKGVIRVGSDADLAVIDPGREVKVTARALHMRSDYSPYEGMRLRGFPVATVLRGQVIQQDGRFLGRAGGGQFVKRG
jgi:dihydropyrimidinase